MKRAQAKQTEIVEMKLSPEHEQMQDYLHKEHAVIKENLGHMKKDIENLHKEVKDQKSWFQQRLDRLDSRIWALVILVLGSLLASVLRFFIG